MGDVSLPEERDGKIMIFKKLRNLLLVQFSVPERMLTEEALLVEDLGLDYTELAMALEEHFLLEDLDDLSNLETLGDLIDFLQMELEGE